MSARDQILSRLSSSSGPSVLAEPWIRAASAAPDLWARFQERLETLGGRLLPLSEVEFIGTVFADDDAWNALPADLRSSLSRADDVWTADSGLTLVDRAVAETGSLVLSAGGGRARLASLAPPRHVALVREDQIVSSLDEALAGLTGRTSVLISGPSRTADIAGILVRGIHGPKELIVAIY